MTTEKFDEAIQNYKNLIKTLQTNVKINTGNEYKLFGFTVWTIQGKLCKNSSQMMTTF